MALSLVGVNPSNSIVGADVAPTGSPRMRAAGEDAWWGSDGQFRRLFRPQFVPAGELLDGARSILPPGFEIALDPLRRRLLLTGSPTSVESAAEAIDFLDVPSPSASIEVTIVETGRHRRSERGGHGLFDRAGPPAGPDTFFRELRFDFEPESWLRSELVGEDPFQGASLHGAQSGTGGPLAGSVDAVLRSLSQIGEAEILARPSLVVTEGVPAFVSATLELPFTVFARAEAVKLSTISEHAGVRLELTAEKIGSDRLTLKLHPWVRRLTEAQSPTGPAGYAVLAVRELTTTVNIADGQEVLLGGVESWQRVSDATGLPVPPALAAITSVLGSRRDERVSLDLVFRVRARILHPGRAASRVVPPGETDRLRRGEIASRVPRPPSR